jgi:chemotaxis protein CheZ
MTNAADDFDALFEEVSAQSKTAAPAPAPAPAPAAAPAAEGDADEGHDKPMFERLGGIVRLLHDSLRELGYDKALTEASSQITDAQDRLEYVASLTEQAANKVLNTLDEGMPEQDKLSKKSKDMENRWADLFAGKLSLDQFKQLAGDSQAFAPCRPRPRPRRPACCKL